MARKLPGAAGRGCGQVCVSEAGGKRGGTIKHVQTMEVAGWMCVQGSPDLQE